jgi:hypothetical protein
MDKIRDIGYPYPLMNSLCVQSTWFQSIPGTPYPGVITVSSLELMELAQAWGKGDGSLTALFAPPSSYGLPTAGRAPALSQLAGVATLSANTWLPACDYSLGEPYVAARFQDYYSPAWSSTPGPVRPALFDTTMYLGWSSPYRWSDAWQLVGSAELTAYDKWLRRRGRTYKQVLKAWYRDGRRQPPRWAAARAVGRKRARALPSRCARRSGFHRPCPRSALKNNANSADVDAPQISMSMRWLNCEINTGCVTN